MIVIQDFIPIGKGVRTGYKLTKCLGLVVHWIGVCQPRAEKVRESFLGTNLGTQYICDWNDGHIIQVAPEDEVCYHVGSEYGYTDLKKKLVGNNNPNWYFVGIECCIGDKAIPSDWSTPGKHMELGRPSDKQYAALVEFAADFLTRHNLTSDSLYRHYDITGKLCHVWFVKDGARWDKFKDDVKNEMEGNGMTEEQCRKIAREEAERAIARYEEDVSAAYNREGSPWAKEPWERAKTAGVFDGTRPTAPLTREQAAVTYERLGLLKGGV